jgi:peptidylprolyl isomerase
MALEKPVVGQPGGPPPADLVIEDLTVGDGPEVRPGQQAVVHYVGVSHATGREFDASASRSAAGRSSPAGTRAWPG